MPNAMTTVGQGSAAYLAVGGNAITNSSTTNWKIGGKQKVHSLAANAQLAGASNSTQHIVRVYTDGSIAFRTAATDRARSAAGVISAGVDFEWSLRNEVGVGMTLNVNGTDLPTFATSMNFVINQLHRFSTTSASEVTTYSFFHEFNGVLQSVWDDTNAAGTGTTWTSSGPVTRTLTITSATGEADSWWLYYAAGVYVRAMLQKLGIISQIADAELGTGKKPLVLLSDGTIKERVASEGLPLIYDPAIAGLRTIASNEILQI